MGPGEIIGFVVFGLIIGVLARFMIPGRDPMGWLATIGLGILGSFVGGGIAFMLRLGGQPYGPAGWIFSIIGAVVTLLLYYKFAAPRRI